MVERMDFIHFISINLFSPPILFFALGVIACFFKSDLEVPDSISSYLSIYLMMAIGFKGGVALSNTAILDLHLVCVTLFGIGFSFLYPFFGYGMLMLTTRLDKATAAAVAAHYGSISMVTFATAAAFLKSNAIHYAGYIVAVLALMEAPAILSGLFIAHRADPMTRNHGQEEKRLTREIFTNGAILLLLGAFVIGSLTGQSGMEQVEGFLVKPFQGFLCLFLLDMGLLVGKKIGHLRTFSPALFVFGLYMPLIGAGIGLISSYLIGLDIGTATLLMVLCASASYIAVPAAIRLALPEAKAAVYLPLSLAITFPFNVTIGIPIYYSMAVWALTP